MEACCQFSVPVLVLVPVYQSLQLGVGAHRLEMGVEVE